MSKDIYFYDSAGVRRRVKELYFYDSAGVRRTVKEGYFYDSAGTRRQFYANSTAPVVTTQVLNTLVASQAFSQQLTASGATPITWAVTAGTLPAGLTLSTSGLLSGTPTGAGAYNFTVTATNAQGSGTKQYTGNVLAAPVAPTITTTVLNTLTTTQFFVQPISATGDTPITFTLQAGTLPAGITLSSSGVLSGTPTAAGAYNFTVRATNSAGFDDQVYTGSVVAYGIPTITTTSLGAMFQGTPFSQQMEASGITPLTWSVVAGSLPTGLTLLADGLLSGTPTAPASYSVTIRATNSAGSNDKVFTGNVRWASLQFKMTAGKADNNPNYGYNQSRIGGNGYGSISPATVVCPGTPDLPGQASYLTLGRLVTYNTGVVDFVYEWTGATGTMPTKNAFKTLIVGGTVGQVESSVASFSISGNNAIWSWNKSQFTNGDGQIRNGVTYNVMIDAPAALLDPTLVKL